MPASDRLSTSAPTTSRRLPRLPSARARAYATVVVALILSSVSFADKGTTERLRAEIESYKQHPTDAQQARIEASFAELDAQIARTKADAADSDGAAKERATQRAEQLGKTRDELKSAYNSARIDRLTGGAKDTARSVEQSVAGALKNAQRKIQGMFGKDGDAK